jgi:hypothetical protein|uniref:Uncharacterized protein n=1 Tax=Mus musculus TaxID=10090 RepID=Q8BPW4_MOUSE|nr:unnamed protein product [Mus musculus]
MNFGMGVGIAYFSKFGVLCFGWSLSLLVPYCLYQAKGQFWRFLLYLWALRSLEGERVSCNFLCTVAIKLDSDIVFVTLFFLFETGLLTEWRLASGSSCLCLPGAGITGMYHHAWLSQQLYVCVCVLVHLCVGTFIHGCRH